MAGMPWYTMLGNVLVGGDMAAKLGNNIMGGVDKVNDYRSNSNFGDAYGDVNKAATSSDLANFTDEKYGYMTPEHKIELNKIQKAKLTDLQGKEAAPTQTMLKDFADQGYTSDPSFTGKEWAEGLLTTPAFSGTDKMPNMANPDISKSVSDFEAQGQKEKSYSDQLQRMGMPVQDSGSLSRFALDPKVTEHLTSLEKAPSTFAAPVENPRFKAALDDAAQIFQPVKELDEPGIEAFKADGPFRSPLNPDFKGIPAKFTERQATPSEMYSGVLQIAGRHGLDREQTNTLAGIVEKGVTAINPKEKAETAAYKVGHMRTRQEGRGSVEESFLGGDPNDLKNWKPLSRGERDKPQQDGFSAYMNRPTSMFDNKVGRVVKVRAGDAADNPDRYIDPRDPDVVTLTQASRYEGAVGGFVKSIDEVGKVVKHIMDKTGLNKNSKAMNYTTQQLLQNKMLGSGDVAGLNNAMFALQGELGKMAEGSMGVAAVSVETAKRYKESISVNMPVGEFFKMYNWAREEGKGRRTGLRNNVNDIRARLGAGARKEAPDTEGKTVVKQFTSPSTGKTKTVYSDGTEEIK